MILSRRWQDWATTVVGALVALSPFVFTGGFSTSGSWAQTASICAAVGWGGLIFVVGLLTLFFPRASWLEFAQIVLAVLLFASPWLFAYTALTAMAWTAYIGAVVVVLAVAARLVQKGPALKPST